jgi:hypothetical protein
MTFGNNIRQLLNYVYGNIVIDKEEIDKLNEVFKFEKGDDNRIKLMKMKAINNLFKNVSFQLLKELNELEREHGGKLRIRQPTDLNLSDKVEMDLNDLFDLYNENKIIGINNLKLKFLINKMKE